MMRRVLVLGCGSVAQCTVPLLVRDLAINPSAVTIVDMVDNRDRVREVLAAGVTYENAKITPDNLDQELTSRVAAGDLVLDLAWNIDTATIVDWCHDHGVGYLNTSVEVWDPYDAHRPPLERTLYHRHMALRRLTARWGTNNGPTAVVEHGANPGLVSHFTKLALTEIAERLTREPQRGPVTALEAALAGDNFGDLALLTGTKVIHISERDTQISDQPKRVDEFVNTWSVAGFHEEGIAPAELGWGTHEKRLPPGALVHTAEGPGNQICLTRPGMETWVRSWVPCGPIHGMVIRHGEAFTINDHLTVRDRDGVVIYRPTVHYAYCPTDAAIASVLELRMRDWDLQPAERIMNDEIVSGRDELGVLLMGHPFRSWWTGSLLSIDEARAVVGHQNATTLQVAGSIVACVKWMMANPNEGLRVPDDLPWRAILETARRYLGTMWSGPVDWDPLQARADPFARYNDAFVDRDDPWQFANFVV